MKLKRLLHFWKSRKYPIKRDEEGRSLRQQAFELFGEGLRPSQIYHQKLIEARKSSLFRYFQDWRKVYKGHLSIKTIKKIRKENPEFNDQLITALSKKRNIPVEEVIKRLDRPWGLKRALLGERPDYSLDRVYNDVESRLLGGLHFIRLSEKLLKSPKELAELMLRITLLNAGDTIKIITPKKTMVWKITRQELEGRINLHMEYSEEPGGRNQSTDELKPM